MSDLITAFEKTVNHYPDKKAVACRDESYTFRELREAAVRLGRRISEELQTETGNMASSRPRSTGKDGAPVCDGETGKPVPIGVMADRSAETVVLFLAVLYSGNFYVAIDPDLPAEKLGKILNDAMPPIILTARPAPEGRNFDSAGGGSRMEHSEEDIPRGTAADSEEEKEPSFWKKSTLALAAAGYTGKILTRDDAESTGKILPRDDAESTGKILTQGSTESTTDEMSAGRPSLTEDSPAYMIYTSGSTGEPKGVLKSHGAVLSFQRAFQETFGLGSDEIIGNQTPFFFDASAKDVYLMVTCGATLEVLPPELFVFPVTLIRYLNERHITYVCWVPTALALVTQLGTFQEVVPETLKKVFFVGEVFPLKQLRKWHESLPDIEYVNLYGSTELAGIACWCRIGDKELAEETLPIGRPLPNCRVRLADENGRSITEPGRTGEIRIASPALADGYYHDPEKTARTFVNLPAAEAAGSVDSMTCPAAGSGDFMTGPAKAVTSSGDFMAGPAKAVTGSGDFMAGPTKAAAGPAPKNTCVRELRTGDLACFDHDGLLHFVSRSDDQIKLQGRRIELGEISAAADRLPEILRCCAMFNEKRRKIILFAEPAPGCEAGPRDIIRKLKGMLSDYMVPGKVIFVERMPMNANGKIDRTRLKEMM